MKDRKVGAGDSRRSVEVVFAPLGDLELDVAARAAALASGEASGEASGAIFADDPEPSSCVAMFRTLAARAPDAVDRLAHALASCPSPGRAMRRLLDAPSLDPLLRSPDGLEAFVVVASASATYGRFVAVEPERLTQRAERIAALDAEIEARIRDDGRVTPELMQALRMRKRLRMVDVVLGEATQSAPIAETSRWIAEAASEAIADGLRAAVRQHDAAALRIVVLGMGKLGGGELNFSSDVDLVYVADPASEADWDPAIAARVARTLTECIDQVTESGPVFRVDLRLRPWGTQGPLVVTRRQLRTYLDTTARGWERGAMLKARAVAGPPDVAAAIEADIGPFVYRRYLDEAAIDEIVQMKATIDRTASSRGPATWDVKLGDGGIREVEFFVQAFQLVYGGQDPELCVRSTPDALARLVARGLVGEADAHRLRDAWTFLRLLEHRIQMEEERQTQSLPADAGELTGLALRMGFSDASAFGLALEGHREGVRACFSRLFAESRAQDDGGRWVEALVDAEDPVSVLASRGFQSPERVWAELQRLFEGRGPALGPRSERAVRRAVRGLVASTLATTNPDRAVSRIVDLVSTRGGRATAVRLGGGGGRATQVLTGLFAASESLGRMLARQPGTIESVLSGGRALVPAEDLAESLEQALLVEDRRTSGNLRERRLARMRRFRAVEEVRVTLAELAGLLDARAATRKLSEIAEVCLSSAGSEAADDLAARDGHRTRSRMGALALGKLGGMELGHGSDLDVVFVFDDDPLEVNRYARLAQRWVSFVVTPMAGGVLYAVDMRLRPDGTQGAVVTTVDGLLRYYRERAWPWEVVALLRARPVACPGELAARLDAGIEATLDAADFDAMNAEIGRLRVRRLEQHASRGGGADVKLSAGGIADLEHLVHLLQLRARAAGRWQGQRESNAWAAIERLEAVGTLARRESQALLDTLSMYRQAEGWLRLDRGDEQTSVPTDDRALESLGRRVLARPVRGGFAVAFEQRCRRVMDLMERFGLAGL